MNELISSMSFLMAKHCREMHTKESSYDLMDAETKCDNKYCVFRKTGKCSEGRYEENWKKIGRKYSKKTWQNVEIDNKTTMII